MWTALQTAVAVPSNPLAASPKGWWARNRSLVISTVGAAAVLMLAFPLGNQRFGGLKGSHFAAADVKGIGTSAAIYSDDRKSFAGVDSSLPTLSPEPPVYQLAQQQRSAANPERRERPADAPSASRESAKRAIVTPGGGVTMAGDVLADAPAQALSPPTIHGIELEAKLGSFKDSTLAVKSPESKGKDDRPQPAAAQPEKAQSAIPQNLKIIKTGELTIQVPGYGDAVSRVEQIVAEKGGFVADAATREEAGGALVGHIVIRVSPERFEETFNALKAVGRVESENVKAADVTAEFVDTEARMKSLQITEERLRELIANKSFVDNIA